MGNGVTHFEIIGKDGPKLQTFYGDVFGWHIDAINPMNYGMVDTHAGGINGGIGPGMSPDVSWVTIYVEVDDLQKTLDKAEKAGAKVVMPPSEVPGGPTIAQFMDPEGHLIGLSKGM